MTGFCSECVFFYRDYVMEELRDLQRGFQARIRPPIYKCRKEVLHDPYPDFKCIFFIKKPTTRVTNPTLPEIQK